MSRVGYETHNIALSQMPIEIDLFGIPYDARKVHATMTRFDKPIRNGELHVAPPMRAPAPTPAHVKGQQPQPSIRTSQLKSVVVRMSAATIIERELDNLYDSGTSYESMPVLDTLQSA